MVGKYTLVWRGGDIESHITAAAKKALLEIGADLQQLSSDEAPVDTGDLRGDAKVDKNEIKNLVVRVGYALPYALRQHEEIGYNHPMGGKAKFLEDPFRANQDKYIEYLSRKIGGAITRIAPMK